MRSPKTLAFLSMYVLASIAAAQTSSPPADNAGNTKRAADDAGSLKRQVSTLQAQVRALRSELATQSAAREVLQDQVASMQKHLDAISRAVKGLQGNSILDLNGYLTLDNSSGYPTALFRGINVQVVNGTGNTQTANGLGNLIVGYNKRRTGQPVCSIGYFATQSECLAQGGAWGSSHKTGSHNIVGGDFNAYSAWGGLIIGVENAINAPYSSVSAGSSNVASGDLSSIAGGSFNTSAAMYSSVGGGLSNMAGAPFATVGGGSSRKAERTYTWKAGGLTQDQ